MAVEEEWKMQSLPWQKLLVVIQWSLTIFCFIIRKHCYAFIVVMVRKTERAINAWLFHSLAAK